MTARRASAHSGAAVRPGRASLGHRALTEMLGRASALWERLHARLAAEFGPLTEKWTFSKTTNRWSVQLKRKQRTVVYLIPRDGHVLAAFALGERACAAARDGGLPATVLAVIDGATRYPEGRAVRLEVRSGSDVDNVLKVAAIKMAH